MNQQPQQRINNLISTVQRYFPLLIVPAVVGLFLALIYAFLLMPEMWTARQSFLIRDDLSGTSYKPGQFDSEESRKSAQETILEVARRPLVIRNVLEKLGPESSLASSDWITDEVIEDTQKLIDISAPNGAEFGKTDAIVLTAKDSTRERTRKFIELLSEEIMTQTNRIRSLRFESMESELYQTYQAASQARDDAIDRLDKLDQRLGSDFGFLSLQGNQTTGVEGIKSEILRKQDELEKAEAVFAALLKAFENPADVAQLPSEVLVAQPALENSMSKMVDLREQLHLAKGLFSNKHARVRALVKAIEFSQQQLYDSLTGEMAGVQSDIALKKRQLVRLNNRIENLKARLIRLSKSRSEHSALTTQVQQLGESANLAKTAWTETKSRAKTARTVGLITPTDVAQVSSRPDGIGKRTIALAGLLGGLLVGTGLILLVAPPMTPQSTNNTAALQSSGRQNGPGQMPRHRASDAAGNSVSGGPFQHAASAMQSAADAMRMAAASGATAQQVVPPSPTETVSQPVTKPVAQPVGTQPVGTPTVGTQPVGTQPVGTPTVGAQPASTPPAANVSQLTAGEAARMAFQSQSPSTLPRDARAQPVTEKAGPKKRTQQTERKPNPFTRKQGAEANVRPVDLAKSASENNEFVRVNPGPEVIADNATDQALQMAKADTLPAGQIARHATEAQSSVSKSAQAVADTIAANRPSPRTSDATIILGDDEKPSEFQTADNQRKQLGTEPFVVDANGETPQTPTTIDQDVIDAIPEQIRKLSDSILSFGKNKKQ